MDTNEQQSCYSGFAPYPAKPHKGGGTSSRKGARHSDRGSKTKGKKASQPPQQHQHSFSSGGRENGPPQEDSHGHWSGHWLEENDFHVGKNHGAMTNPGATKDKSYSAGKHGAACGTTSDPSKNANDLRPPPRADAATSLEDPSPAPRFPNAECFSGGKPRPLSATSETFLRQQRENPAELQQGVKGDKKIVSKKADTTATFRKKDYFYLKQRRSDPVLILGELFAVLWPEEIADFGMRFDFDIVGEVVRHKKSVRPDVLWSASGALCTVLWRKEPERRVEEEVEQFAATGGAAFDRRPFLFAAFHREYRSFLICAVSASSFSSEKAAGWEHQRRVQECFDRIESSLRETGKMGLFRRRIRVRIPRATLDAAVQITPLNLMLELGSTEAEAEQQLEHVRSTSTELPRYDGQEHVGAGPVAAVTATDSHPKITEPKIIHEVEAGAALNSLDWWTGLDESEKGIVRNSATTLPNSGRSDGVFDHMLSSGHEKRMRSPRRTYNANNEEVLIPRKEGLSSFAVAVAVVSASGSDEINESKCSHESKRESAREKSESVLAPKVVADPFVPAGSPTAGLWATGSLPGSSLPSEQSSAAAPISLSSPAFACVTSMSILWEYWLKQSEVVEAGRAQYYCSYGLKSKSAEEAEKPGKEIEMKIALRRLALHLEGYREGDGRVFTLARDVLPMFVHQRGATGSSTVKRENTAASERGLGPVGTDDASDAAVTSREDGGSGEGDKKENGRRRAPPGPSRRILLAKLARDAFLMSPKQGWRIESIEDAATTLGAPPSEFVSYELSFSLITRQLNVSTLSAAMVSLDVDLNRKGKNRQVPDSQRANPSRRGVLQQVRALLKQRRVGPLGSLDSWIRHHEVAVPEVCREDFDLNFCQWQCQRLLGEPYGANPVCVSVPSMDAKREDQDAEPSQTEQDLQEDHHLARTIFKEERRQRALSMPNRGRVGFLPILNWVQAKVVDLPEAAYSFREIALPSRRLLSYVPPPGCVYDICSGFMSWVSKWMAHSFAARMAGLPDLFARMWERKLEPRPYCAVADVARYGPVWHDDLSALETHTQTSEEIKQNADGKTGRGARPDKASPVLQGLQPIRVEVFRDLDAQRVMATLMSLSGSSLTEWNERTAVIPALDDAASIGANPLGVKLVRERYLDPHKLQFAREAAAGEPRRARSGRRRRDTNKRTIFEGANTRHPHRPSDLSNSPDGRLSLSLPLRTLFVGKDAVYNFCKWRDRCDRRYIPVRAPTVSSSAAVKLQEQESARLEEELRPRLESRSRDAGGGGMGGHKGNKGGMSSMHAAENSTGKKGKQMLSSDCGKGMGKGKEKGGKKGQEELDPDVDDLPPVVPMFIQDLLDTKFRECCAGGGQQQQAAEEGAVRHSLEDMALLVDYLGVPYCRAPGTKLYCLSILFTGGASVGFLY